MDIITEWSFIAALVFSIFCTFVFTYTSQRLNRPSKAYNLPPSPPKLPIIGNLHQLLGRPRHEALWQLSKQYGPLMQIQIGSKQILVISSPPMAKQVLKTQDHIFCNRQPFQATKQLSYNFVDVVFSPHNAHWKEMCKLLVSELMGPKRAKVLHRVLVTEIENVIHSLSPNTAVNLNDMFLDIVKQMMCKVAFGNNYREQPLKGPSWDVMLDETIDLLNGSVSDSFPLLGFFIDRLSGWNRTLNERFRNLDAYIDAIIDDHLKDNVEEISEEDKDFVHTLLEMSSKENASGFRLNHADLKALVMNIFIAGIDTTALVMLWAMSEIIKNPRVMKKLQSEIRNNTEKIQKAEEMNTTKMTYLKMVVKETLRLHTPAPLLIPHESLSHTQIDGYDILPNTPVIINAWGIARDPSTWGENAAKFYPERFENVGGDFGPDGFEMLPFGGGRRSCLAMNSAPTNVEFVIANLLYWFDWEPASGTKCEDLNMEDFGTIVLGKKVPLCLVPTKHKWKN
ncbi:putative cytochrome P450 [Helianthus debilis subsp. tardiflorus]